MNEIVITVVAFVTLSFVIAQIRFIRRLIRLKNKNVKLGGVIVLSMSELICELFACGGGLCCEALTIDSGSSRHRSDTSKKVKTLETRTQKHLSELKEQNKETQKENELKETVNDLLMNTKKISLQWVSKISMIPIESVTDILSEDPSFLIDGDYVLKNLDIPKRDSIEFEEEKTKTVNGVCPDCSSTILPGAKYCPVCGLQLY